MSDNVNHPNHYNHGGVECFDALRAALGDKYMGFLIGNVIKYCWRYEHKNGIEDLQKAKAYIDEAIKEMHWRTGKEIGKEITEQIASRGEQHD
jgi:hypothetical protein